MPIEIEKKYRLTKKDRRALEQRMRELGYEPKPIEFEENTIYGGGRLNFGSCALRLRRVNGNERAYLTFKRRLPGKSPIKHQEEHQVTVADPDGMDWILNSLEFRPALVYEKRRARWKVGQAKVVIDELSFGLFMEIEASVKEIKRVERLIGAEDLPAVSETYPTLTANLGKKSRGVIEARFKKKRLEVRSRRRVSNRDSKPD
jgi:predicted adenylyl cyclase CyaB